MGLFTLHTYCDSFSLDFLNLELDPKRRLPISETISEFHIVVTISIFNIEGTISIFSIVVTILYKVVAISEFNIV